MKRRIAGSVLMIVGLVLASVAVLGASAAEPGECYISVGTGDCVEGLVRPDTTCDQCLAAKSDLAALGFDVVWYGDIGDGDDCQADCGEPTAVTFLGFSSPITACNAKWAVPGVGALGMIIAAAGLVVLKRQGRAG